MRKYFEKNVFSGESNLQMFSMMEANSNDNYFIAKEEKRLQK